MMKLAYLVPAILGLTAADALAQRSPDTVFLEELTWDEVRDAIAEGKTSVIIPTGGTEQNGPHLATGKHRFILEYTTDRIARELGNALVAPILSYSPAGSWDDPRGGMSKPGTLTLPHDRFVQVLEQAAQSLKAGGFTDIVFIGDSGGNQEGMRDLTEELNLEWAGTAARAHFIGDYYSKSRGEIRSLVMDVLGISEDRIGGHAGIVGTSQVMFVRPEHVRADRIAPDGGFPDSGASGDPTLASADLGREMLSIKIRNAVAQVRASVSARGGGPR